MRRRLSKFSLYILLFSSLVLMFACGTDRSPQEAASSEPAVSPKEVSAPEVAALAEEIVLTDEHRKWIVRIKGFTDHREAAFQFGPQLVRLDPDFGYEVVTAVWPELAVAEVKQGLLKAFAFGKHPPDDGDG